jgi:thymidylate kinase
VIKVAQRLIEKRGMHIGFAGIDGAGKSTQASLLCKWLKDKKINAIWYEEKRNFVSEITDTIARKHGIDSGRKYLGEGLYLVSISFEVLRQNLLNIHPYLDLGITIVTSRTIFDWIAGGMARDCPEEEFKLAREIFFLGGIPDLTIWLDTSPEVAYGRVIHRKFDRVSLNYLRRYQMAFKKLFENYPCVRINGDEKIEVISSTIQQIVEKKFFFS